MTGRRLSAPGASDHKAALLAGYLGWTLDAFDYFLVVMCLTAIGREFHKSDEQIAIATWVTLGFRPVGAFLFGLLADRYGRRLPLMIDLVFYSILEVLSGLAPDFTTFLILRALFGVGMGGEWGVGASLALEKAPPKWRGLLSGFLQQGYAMGFLLASVAYNFIFPKYGWRPLFLIGGIPALLAVFVRMRVKESEVWERHKPASWKELRGAIFAQWKLLFYLMIFMMAMNLASHGTQDMYPTFLLRQRGFTVSERSFATGISMVGAILGGTFFGLMSDRYGRRRSIIVALAFAIAAIPLWAYSKPMALVVSGAFLIQFMVQGAWGVVPAHLTELSPDSIRGFLPGFGYQMGVLLASPVNYVEAAVASHTSYATAMSVMAALFFAMGIIAAALGKEKRGVGFG
ncbi:MAG TPA: MFS transporter [Bryobacteraceae bacterium]|nr:MFS transporter [Bryobacteraceae bacterium]